MTTVVRAIPNENRSEFLLFASLVCTLPSCSLRFFSISWGSGIDCHCRDQTTSFSYASVMMRFNSASMSSLSCPTGIVSNVLATYCLSASGNDRFPLVLAGFGFCCSMLVSG